MSSESNMEAIEQEIDITSLPDNSIFENKHIPIGKMIELRSKDLSYQQVADLCGCSKANVIRRLKEYQEDIKDIDSFKKNRADIFVFHQSRLLKSITTDDIKSMAPASRITAAAILYDKERLERGQSTSNVISHSYVQKIDDTIVDIRAKLEALEDEEPE